MTKMQPGDFRKQVEARGGSQRALDVARRLDVLLADVRRKEAAEQPASAEAHAALSAIRARA